MRSVGWALVKRARFVGGIAIEALAALENVDGMRRGGMARLRATHDHRQWLAEGHSSFEARFFFFPFFFQPEKSVYRKSSIRITTAPFTRGGKNAS